MKTKRVPRPIGTAESMTVEWKSSLAQMGAIVDSVAAFAATDGVVEKRTVKNSAGMTT